MARGRVSAAALTVVGGVSGVRLTQRPVPPDELSEAEANEWRQIVDRLPADWFGRETIPMLVQYVRHIVRVQKLNGTIKSMEARQGEEDFNYRLYMALLRAETNQSRIISTLATKMRISQQSTYDKSKRKPSKTQETENLWSKDY
jgi:hypothetical protein